MPLYEYKCEECGVRFTRRQNYSDAPISECPECSGHVHRVIGPTGIIFKGSGFYVTDNRHSNNSAGPASSKSASDSADSKSETKSESKAEAKTESKPSAASDKG